MGLSTGLFILARSPIVMVVARGLQGLSAAAVWVVGLALIVHTVGKDGIGEAMGHATAGMTLGGMVAPILGGVA